MDASGKWPEDGIDLVASRLLARNALSALRGPMSRGAVPLQVFAEEIGKPRNTAARIVERRLGEDRSTPFDLAARRTFDPELNGHQRVWEEGLKAWQQGASQLFPPGMGDDALDLVRQVATAMLERSFASQTAGDFRMTLVNSHLLTAAALAHSGETDPEAAGELERARERVTSLARGNVETSTRVYTSALKLILRGTSRRPRAGYRVEDVVAALGALFDGYILRHLLDPATFPLRTLVDSMFDLATGMTEPGFSSSQPAEPHTLRETLLATALSVVRSKERMPSLEEVASVAGVGRDVAAALLGEEGRLADACLDFALAGASQLRDLALGVRGSGMTTLEEVLRVVAEVADEYRALAEAAPDAPVWTEIRGLLEEMLESVDVDIHAVDIPTAASVLLRAALRGAEGAGELETAMEIMTGRRQDLAGRRRGARDREVPRRL